VHVISLSRSLAEAVISLNIVQKPKKKASRQPLTCRLSQRVPRISHVLWPTGARHHRASAPVVGRGLTLLLVPQSPPCERPRTKCWLLGMVKSRASHRPRATTAARQPPTASRSPPRQRIAPPGCHCSSMLRAVSPPWRWPAHTRRPSRPSRRQLGLSLPPRCRDRPVLLFSAAASPLLGGFDVVSLSFFRLLCTCLRPARVVGRCHMTPCRWATPDRPRRCPPSTMRRSRRTSCGAFCGADHVRRCLGWWVASRAGG